MQQRGDDALVGVFLEVMPGVGEAQDVCVGKVWSHSSSQCGVNAGSFMPQAIATGRPVSGGAGHLRAGPRARTPGRRGRTGSGGGRPAWWCGWPTWGAAPGRRGAPGGEPFGVDDAGREQEAAHEHLQPFHQDFTGFPGPGQAQRQRDGNLPGRAVSEGIENEQPLDPLGVGHRPGQPDRAAPVLRHDRSAVQVQRLQQRIERLDAPADGAEARGAWLLGAAEAEVVGTMTRYLALMSGPTKLR